MQAEASPHPVRGRLYALLHAAREDLAQASTYAAGLLRLVDRDNHDDAGIDRSALEIALVITYLRPFFPVRGMMKVQEQMESQYDRKQRTLHSKLVRLKESLHAHTNASLIAAAPTSVGGKGNASQYGPDTRLPEDSVRTLTDMIDRSLAYVQTRIDQGTNDLK